MTNMRWRTTGLIRHNPPRLALLTPMQPPSPYQPMLKLDSSHLPPVQPRKLSMPRSRLLSNNLHNLIFIRELWHRRWNVLQLLWIRIRLVWLCICCIIIYNCMVSRWWRYNNYEFFSNDTCNWSVHALSIYYQYCAMWYWWGASYQDYINFLLYVGFLPWNLMYSDNTLLQDSLNTVSLNWCNNQCHNIGT